MSVAEAIDPEASSTLSSVRVVRVVGDDRDAVVVGRLIARRRYEQARHRREYDGCDLGQIWAGALCVGKHHDAAEHEHGTDADDDRPDRQDGDEDEAGSEGANECAKGAGSGELSDDRAGFVERFEFEFRHHWADAAEHGCGQEERRCSQRDDGGRSRAEVGAKCARDRDGEPRERTAEEERSGDEAYRILTVSERAADGCTSGNTGEDCADDASESVERNTDVGGEESSSEDFEHEHQPRCGRDEDDRRRAADVSRRRGDVATRCTIAHFAAVSHQKSVPESNGNAPVRWCLYPVSHPIFMVFFMELLPILVLSVSFAAIAAVGFAVLYWLLRRSVSVNADAARGEAVDSAVQSALKVTLAERAATAQVLERDRDATMHAAVDIAMARVGELADAKLDARLRVGTENLEKNMALGTEKLEKNMALGHQKYEASTSIIEKQNAELRGEMKRIEKMMSEFQEKTAGQHGMLVNQLEEAAKATGQLQQTAGSLREALGSTKKRGNWGERMAQDVLTHAGMKEGLNYRVQKGIESGGRPDFTFLMPHEMVLHMDVKFPADNYLSYLEADGVDNGAATHFRKQFIKDARARVKELAERRYHEEENSVDTVVLLIPNESIFAFVQENDPELMDIALRSKIVLCGPSTLMAVLQVVRQAMDNFMLERQSTEILECLTGFRKEWSKYSDALDKHGKHMTQAMNSFEALAGTRTNVLQRNLDKIDRLQAASPAVVAVTSSTKQSEPDLELSVADNEGWRELRTA